MKLLDTTGLRIEPINLVDDTGLEIEPEPASKVGGIFRSLAAGTVGQGLGGWAKSGAMWGLPGAERAVESLENLSERLRVPQEGLAEKSLYGGLESTAGSLTAGLPLALATRGRAGIGGRVGRFIAGKAITFTMAEYYDFVNDAEEVAIIKGATPEEVENVRKLVMPYAAASGISEGAGEALSDMLSARILGLIGSKTVSRPIKDGIKALGKEYLKRLGMTLPGELIGEEATTYAESKLREKVGIPMPSLMEQAKETAGVVAVQTSIQTLFGLALAGRRRSKSIDRLKSKIAEQYKTSEDETTGIIDEALKEGKPESLSKTIQSFLDKKIAEQKAREEVSTEEDTEQKAEEEVLKMTDEEFVKAAQTLGIEVDPSLLEEKKDAERLREDQRRDDERRDAEERGAEARGEDVERDVQQRAGEPVSRQEGIVEEKEKIVTSVKKLKGGWYAITYDDGTVKKSRKLPAVSEAAPQAPILETPATPAAEAVAPAVTEGPTTAEQIEKDIELARASTVEPLKLKPQFIRSILTSLEKGKTADELLEDVGVITKLFDYGLTPEIAIDVLRDIDAGRISKATVKDIGQRIAETYGAKNILGEDFVQKMKEDVEPATPAEPEAKLVPVTTIAEDASDTTLEQPIEQTFKTRREALAAKKQLENSANFKAVKEGDIWKLRSKVEIAKVEETEIEEELKPEDFSLFRAKDRAISLYNEVKDKSYNTLKQPFESLLQLEAQVNKMYIDGVVDQELYDEVRELVEDVNVRSELYKKYTGGMDFADYKDEVLMLGEFTNAVVKKLAQAGQTGEVSLELLVPEKLAEFVESSIDNIRQAMSYARQLGSKIYEAGARTFEQFKVEMKKYLSKVWAQIEPWIQILFDESGAAYFSKITGRVETGPEGKGIKALHGTGRKFEKFSLEHIRSGTGGLAEGYGLYFSTLPQIQKYYADVTGKTEGYEVKIAGKELSALMGPEHWRSESVIQDLVYQYSQYKEGKSAIDFLKAIRRTADRSHEKIGGAKSRLKIYSNLLRDAVELINTSKNQALINEWAKRAEEYRLTVEESKSELVLLEDLQTQLREVRTIDDIVVRPKKTKYGYDVTLWKDKKVDELELLDWDAEFPYNKISQILEVATREDLHPDIKNILSRIQTQEVTYSSKSLYDKLTDIFLHSGDPLKQFFASTPSTEVMSVTEAKRRTSQLLRDAGFLGIVYNSWEKSNPKNRNFVVFDEEAISIENVVTLESLGLQSAYEAIAKWVKHWKARRHYSNNTVSKLERDQNSIFIATALGLPRPTEDQLVTQKPSADSLWIWLNLLTPEFSLRNHSDALKLASTLVNAVDTWNYKRDQGFTEVERVKKELSKEQQVAVTIAMRQIEAGKSVSITDPAVQWGVNELTKFFKTYKVRYQDFLAQMTFDEMSQLELAIAQEVLATGGDIKLITAKYNKVARTYNITMQKQNKPNKIKLTTTRKMNSYFDQLKEAASWGLDDYITHAMRGNITLLDEEGRIISVAETVAQATEQARKFLAADPSISEITLDNTVWNLGEMPTLVSAKHYRVIVGKIQKELRRVAQTLHTSINTDAQKLLGRAVAIKPRKMWSQFVQEREGDLPGMENVFDILGVYVHSMEKKLALDPYARVLQKSLNDFRDRPNVRAALEQQLTDARGRYWLGDRILDEVMKGVGYGIGKTTGTYPGWFEKPYSFSRLTRHSRYVAANVKLGYRATSSLINLMAGMGKVYAKFGARYMYRAARELRTPAGRAFMEKHAAALGVALEDIGGKLTAKSSWFSPLGGFQAAESPNRKVSFMAGYLFAKENFKYNDEEAVKFAANTVRLLQNSYNIAALPRWLRGPGGKTIGQFKLYLEKEIEFIAQLKGFGQWSRYLTVQALLAGPRGIMVTLKSFPLIALFASMGGWLGGRDFVEGLERWMNVTYPKLTRGIGGLLGVDVTYPATFQFPEQASDFFGIIPSMLINIHKKVYVPMKENWPYKLQEGQSLLRQEIPIYAMFSKAIESVYNKGWIRDDRGNNLWEVEGPVDYLKMAAGAEPLNMSILRVENRLQQQEQARRQRLAQNVVKRYKLMRGKINTDSVLDSLANDIVTYGLDIANVQEAILKSRLDPLTRRLLTVPLPEKVRVLRQNMDVQEATGAAQRK